MRPHFHGSRSPDAASCADYQPCHWFRHAWQLAIRSGGLPHVRQPGAGGGWRSIAKKLRSLEIMSARLCMPQPLFRFLPLATDCLS